MGRSGWLLSPLILVPTFAGGIALVESMDPGTPRSMVTVYYPDSEKVTMTDYCAERNQPRMVGTRDAKARSLAGRGLPQDSSFRPTVPMNT